MKIKLGDFNKLADAYKKSRPGYSKDIGIFLEKFLK